MIESNDNYFRWLCDRIDCRNHLKYEKALFDLYCKFFYSLIPYDNNRGLDGLDLRKEYENENHILMLRQDMNRPCNLLEMLIALSRRMAFILFDPGIIKSEHDEAEYFWLLISNLKLDTNYRNNLNIIEIFLERQYNYNGEGGLFPLKNPKQDQRNVEIWYQMMAYLNENYI